MIPHFGDKIKDALKYIPFGYIPEKHKEQTKHSQTGNGLLLQRQS